MFETELENINNNVQLRQNLFAIKSQLENENAVEQLKRETENGYFVKFLTNEDPKTRVNAVRILGYLADDNYADTVFEAYVNEETLFTKAAYVKALKHFNCIPYMDRLFERRKSLTEGEFTNEELKHVSAELKALNTILPADRSHVHHFKNPENVQTVYLTTGRDTADELLSQVKDGQKAFCGVKVSTKDIKSLLPNRLYKEILFPINGMRSEDKNGIALAVAKGNLLSILNDCHDNGDKPYRFRITSKTLDLTKIAPKIEVLSRGRLINSPSDYEVEVKLIPAKDGKFGILLKMHTIVDDRFRYRREYVAASMNPVNAAMMVSLVKDYLKEDAQILDPFCGVGTVLIERNKLKKAAHIYGIDTFGKAIEAARNNTLRADRVNINYINRDYFDFTHEYLFDEIITDMPVSGDDMDDFYGRFFDKSAGLLKQNGLIIMYSKEKNIIKKHLRLRDNYRLVREFTFNGKDGISVYVIELLTKN